MKSRLPSIHHAALIGCLTYLAKEIAGKTANPKLLSAALPQGRLIRASVEMDGSIAITVLDEHTERTSQKQTNRTRRLRASRKMDPLAFALLRLLSLAKTDLRISRNLKVKGHWLSIADDRLFTRVIANAGQNEQVTQIGDHYNLQRSKLRKEAGFAKYNSREAAIQLALASFAKLPEKSWQRKALGVGDYEWWLRKCCDLLDRLPLAEHTE